MDSINKSTNNSEYRREKRRRGEEEKRRRGEDGLIELQRKECGIFAANTTHPDPHLNSRFKGTKLADRPSLFL